MSEPHRREHKGAAFQRGSAVPVTIESIRDLISSKDRQYQFTSDWDL
jgi:hypothetical protein